MQTRLLYCKIIAHVLHATWLGLFYILPLATLGEDLRLSWLCSFKIGMKLGAIGPNEDYVALCNKGRKVNYRTRPVVTTESPYVWP